MTQTELLIKDLNLILQCTESIGLNIFLHAGTLLGAIRNNSFIPGDADFDFGLFRKDFTNEMKQKLIDTFIGKNMEFKGFECKAFIQRVEFGDRPYVVKFWSPNAHYNTDFWVFEERENDFYQRGWCGYFYYPKDTLLTLDKIEFYGLNVNVPHNPEKFLENMYGKNWRTPQKMKKPEGYFNWKKELI